MLAPPRDEPEWVTRKERIDKRLTQLGWAIERFDPDCPGLPHYRCFDSLQNL
jgi:hypothetical protein